MTDTACTSTPVKTRHGLAFHSLSLTLHRIGKSGRCRNKAIRRTGNCDRNVWAEIAARDQWSRSWWALVHWSHALRTFNNTSETGSSSMSIWPLHYSHNRCLVFGNDPFSRSGARRSKLTNGKSARWASLHRREVQAVSVIGRHRPRKTQPLIICERS